MHHPATESTVARDIVATGRGLHTGRRVRVRVCPAPAGSGICFRRRGRGGGTVSIPALWGNRVSQPMCTALQAEDGTLVRTVEHLLAALLAFGVDNARVELDAEELPILDGSAGPWCELLREAGVETQDAGRRVIRVTGRFCHRQDNRRICVEPSGRPVIDVTMDLRGFGSMHWRGEPTAEVFCHEIAPARSFGRVKWALPAKLAGLIGRRPVLRGAHLGNVAPVWGGRILGGMRLPDEPVRHRVLDLLGDLALAGRPIIGRVTALRPGHEMNHAFLSRLMQREDLWEEVLLPSTTAGPHQTL
ncbi:MAG TPA: UDP-3-O-[3-hydroxymyristoyl] N-acetylglucosamine deacetylase [Sedimenticola thiotaurini]|uniref:UDP-3-O-acyl-N-acetylglucosamine deacetylase n=1 Tax=Sedimenticola thiotaurini TaxID=1543721 RepID=A0A831RQI4_9GAMM|nr:UDP-3-O-[3-hydroxymyristoyl] N-acetylglucosamine deacetylase [Sedimenticola thiotaurini]